MDAMEKFRSALRDNGYLLFTPRINRNSAIRHRLMISAEDMQKVNTAPLRGQYVVKDIPSGTEYWAQRAPCGAGCYCDAFVIEEV